MIAGSCEDSKECSDQFDVRTENKYQKAFFFRDEEKKFLFAFL